MNSRCQSSSCLRAWRDKRLQLEVEKLVDVERARLVLLVEMLVARFVDLPVEHALLDQELGPLEIAVAGQERVIQIEQSEPHWDEARQERRNRRAEKSPSPTSYRQAQAKLNIEYNLQLTNGSRPPGPALRRGRSGSRVSADSGAVRSRAGMRARAACSTSRSRGSVMGRRVCSE